MNGQRMCRAVSFLQTISKKFVIMCPPCAPLSDRNRRFTKTGFWHVSVLQGKTFLEAHPHTSRSVPRITKWCSHSPHVAPRRWSPNIKSVRVCYSPGYKKRWSRCRSNAFLFGSQLWGQVDNCSGFILLGKSYLFQHTMGPQFPAQGQKRQL